ncbi:MAG: hypothetical protein JOZ12_14325 [Sinobacteraceae bacterium]|nr:hypothetical protein [Nevskiaceae bacterium]MBV8854897.1 hypothetical protein [Nevskiaceae bacterium]
MRASATLSATVAVLATVLAPAVTSAAQYTVTTVDYPGFAGYTMVNGINDAGRVVGDFSIPGTQLTYGFSRSGAPFSLLPSVPCTTPVCETTPLAINARGDVAGEFSNNVAHRQVFLIHAGVLQLIAIPSTSQLALFGGLNERGDVAGYFQTNRGPIHMFTYSKSVFTDIPVPSDFVDVTATGINNGGDITGAYDDARGLHGFIDKKGRFTRFDFPGGINTRPEAINEPGDIVGSYATGPGGTVLHGFLLSHGKFASVDFPGGVNTMPSVISNDRTITGMYQSPQLAAPFNTRAFVLQKGSYVSLPLPGAAMTVSGMNASGAIVGSYFDPSCPVNCRVHGFLATPAGKK